MNNLERRIIQFHHFGEEHLKKDNGGSFSLTDIPLILEERKMPWNDGAHRRKFFKNRGKYVTQEGQIKDNNIMFWGEWEGISTISRINYNDKSKEADNNFPEFIHTPVARRLADYIKHPIIDKKPNAREWQNTDPYVFGNHFLYSNCQQSNGSVMRRLDKGSVIVMGSRRGTFCIDTVFVVGDILCTYSWENLNEIKSLLNEGEISQTFWETTIVPLADFLASLGPNHKYRRSIFTLYKAATYENPVDGMYSFFPCMEYKAGEGFKRPDVTHDLYINPKLCQKYQTATKVGNNKKMQWIVSPMHSVKFWNSIRQQVFDKKLNLGIWAEEPKFENE